MEYPSWVDFTNNQALIVNISLLIPVGLGGTLPNSEGDSFVAYTRHIQMRMSQRGISKRVLELALEFGVVENDKVLLNRKAVRDLIAALNDMKQTAQKALDKGGLVVVETDDGSLVTTYTLDSYHRQAG
jgi:hypothetical protein